MNYLALYRKYRPDGFEDFFGQQHIVEIIKNSIINNKISHAYLFSGPRGTGKTSMAKLIAKTVNCENLNGSKACEKCTSCEMINGKADPDIIEIDAASNNGVDEIRLLKDKVSLAPSVSKFKVYIIDEVHMLTNSAFNALLKTLEEPPAHVIFILATTELYKVPETIVSRCQCFEFESISADDIKECLKNIVKKEKMSADDKVLDLIANYSKGGLRDAIGILDKLSSCSEEITTDLFYKIVGVASDESVNTVLNLILERKNKEVIIELEKLEKNGINIPYLIEQIMLKLKQKVISDGSITQAEKIVLDELNNLLFNVKFSFNYALSLEIGILNIISKIDNTLDVAQNNNQKIEEKSIVNIEENIDKISVKEEKNEQIIVDDIGVNNAFALADKKLKKEIASKWKNFNDYVHNKEFSSIVSYFLDSNLEVAGKEDIIISVSNEATVKNAMYNKVKLELLFNLVVGNYYNLIFLTEEHVEKLKNKYIEDIKSGRKYEYIKRDENSTEKEEKNDIIKSEDREDSNAIKSAKDIFGSDIVEIR